MDMDQESYKVCPECAGEYRPEIELCADCGVPLVYPEEIAQRKAPNLPAVRGIVALRTAPTLWARALARDLKSQKIRYRIDRSQELSDGILTLFVLRRDRAAAEAVALARKRFEAELDPEEESGEPSNVVPFPVEPVTYKVCPRCGGEYRLDVERCADCEGLLVFPDKVLAKVTLKELPEVAADDDLPFGGPLHEVPPSDDLVCVCCRYLGGRFQAVSWALDVAGIAHRLDPAPYRETYGESIRNWCLYVLPADGDAAAAIDAGDWGTATGYVDPDDLTVCPACGTPLPRGAAECGNCGLGLRLGSDALRLDPLCPCCGAVIRVLSDLCPNCGTLLPVPAPVKEETT